jgi:acetyl-CoA carboxylase beta subunit
VARTIIVEAEEKVACPKCSHHMRITARERLAMRTATPAVTVMS